MECWSELKSIARVVPPPMDRTQARSRRPYWSIYGFLCPGRALLGNLRCCAPCRRRSSPNQVGESIIFSYSIVGCACRDATVNIGPRGRDNDSGYGKLVLPIMQVSASPSPQITSVSPSRVRYNQVVTIRGTAFGANRGTSRVIFQGGKEPSSSQYVSWSDTRIQVRVPAGARTGNVQVITANGSDTARLTITSPWISSISPQTGRTNTVVTIRGGNFGSSRGSSTVRIGSVAKSSTSFTSWSSSRIRFRIPRNTPPGNLTVRTSEGTSNAIRLQITSPYLTSISPTQVKTGDRLTLTGGNFGTRRRLRIRFIFF